MNKLSVFIIFFIIMVFMGCGAPTVRLPSVPPTESQHGRDCIRSCQRDHNTCYGAIESSQIVGIDYQKARFAGQCNQKLADCYQFCKTEDKP